MARVFVVLCGVGLAAGLLAQEPGADVPLGSTIKNFYLPHRDEAGRLVLSLQGKEAKVLSVNRTEIRDLTIELYQGREPTVTIRSPRCELWNLESRLVGHDGVRVERKDLQLTSRSIEWDLKSRKGILHGNVRVVLYGLPLGAPPKGLPRNPNSKVPLEGSGGATGS
ncbi:LptA/OstA family protein [Candidatus Methylacidithermus pantelleriae]|uniref:hypothetical protein n=1 Tax=Candidatus Methylacidithermus pantelleriae TaxID=2744239 RepID=UPI001BD53649|nr:hypothetical protein [Candidatus Methylacidithermus pantelleriae]